MTGMIPPPFYSDSISRAGYRKHPLLSPPIPRRDRFDRHGDQAEREPIFDAL